MASIPKRTPVKCHKEGRGVGRLVAQMLCESVAFICLIVCKDVNLIMCLNMCVHGLISILLFIEGIVLVELIVGIAFFISKIVISHSVFIYSVIRFVMIK